MGLSKLFPCCRKPKPKPQAESRLSHAEKKGASSNAKPPPVNDIPAGESVQRAEAAEQEPPKTPEEPKISQKVWNRAYDELAEDEATKALVEDYMMAVQKANRPDEDGDDAVSTSEVEETMARMGDHAERDRILRETVRSGREKIYKSTKLTNAVGGVSEFVLRFKGVIDLAVGTNPQAALPWAGVCIGLQFLLNPSHESKSNEAGIAYVLSRMEWYTSLTKHVLRKENIVIGQESFEDVHRQLETRVTELYKALLLYHMKSACSYYRNQGWTFIRNIISLDDWDGQLNSVKEAEAAVEEDSKQYNRAKTQGFLAEMVSGSQKTQEILGDFHQTLRDYIESQSKKALGEDYDRCLKDLYVVHPQAQMSSIQERKDTLIPEAYSWIFHTNEYKSFADWTDESPCQVLWLNGPAGTGKTMLMIGIIQELYGQSKLDPGISYFFFVADNTTENSAMDALRSLIWLLLLQQPHLISYLVEMHKRSGAAMFHGPNAFWMLRDAFKAMLADKNLSPVYLAFDALDECAEGTKETPGVQSLISLVADTLRDAGENARKIKWLVSSRPEVDVYKKLAQKAAVTELDVMAHKEPVDAYITHKLDQLRTEHGYTQDTLDAISAELRQHENLTFLWVALVLKDLLTGEVTQRKAIKHLQKTPPDLSAIYDRMMEHVDNLEDEEDREICKRLLEVVCFAFRPLSYAEAHIIADLPSDATTEEIVQLCGSFLTCHDDRIHILHNSTRQYLTAYFESHHDGGAARIHGSMAKRCITAMSTRLKYNIHALQPGTEATDVMARENDGPIAPVRYACEFWVDHLCGLDGLREGRVLDGAAVAFLETHFLHWLEGLSLIHKVPSALSSIRKIITSLKKTQDTSPELSSFLKDAERFVLRNLSVIARAPLQIYGAGLAFSPNESEMKTRYWDERLPLIRSIAGLKNSWDPLLQTHSISSGLKHLLFSPDGRFYAATLDSQPHAADGFKRGVVQLWDADTGFHAWTLTLENRLVNAVAFSPDGKSLASQSDTVIQIWSLSTGACAKRFDLKPEEVKDPHWYVGELKSIAFAKDGGALAVAIRDTVEIWDISTAQCTRILRGHSDNTTAVVFSRDGKTIASLSEDGVIKLWDYPHGTCVRTLEGRDKVLRALMLSPDGTKLAGLNGTENEDLDDEFNDTLTVWDLPSGEYSHTIGPEPQVQAAAFSSNGEVFAIASPLSGKIHFLDASSGAPIRTIRGAGIPMDVAVSPSNNLVVSASADETLHIWDTSWISEEALDCHDHAISVVRASPDGKTLATGSVDQTVKIWNAADRTCRTTLGGHPVRVERIAFAPDGETIATGAADGSVRIWTIATASSTPVLGATNPRSPAITFSRDGMVLVTASCDRGGYTVQFWDPSDGTCTKTIDMDGMPESGWRQIIDITLSRDGHTLLIATLCDGGLVIDVPSGTQTHSLRTPDPARAQSLGVCYPAFSPDGTTCALVTSTQELQLWDTASGTLRQAVPLASFPSELSFSEDGKYLKTNKGAYSLQRLLSTPPDAEPECPALHLDGEWLVRGVQRLLWIPPDYRSLSANLGANKVALTSLSGQLVFVEV
ncbi:hypothetical protein BJX61DRAFT_508192, partial [Aspergillus egyptiacus]